MLHENLLITLLLLFTVSMIVMLGTIISPSDAIAANSVLQELKVPRRTVTILEGVSLMNDAASLIVFRFALEAVLTGKFVNCFKRT